MPSCCGVVDETVGEVIDGTVVEDVDQGDVEPAPMAAPEEPESPELPAPPQADEI